MKVGAIEAVLMIIVTLTLVRLGKVSSNVSAKYVVEAEGDTCKYPPDKVVPIRLPPEGESHHRIIFPLDIAVRLEVPPAHIAVGVAVADAGGAGGICAKPLLMKMQKIIVKITRYFNIFKSHI